MKKIITVITLISFMLSCIHDGQSNTTTIHHAADYHQDASLILVDASTDVSIQMPPASPPTELNFNLLADSGAFIQPLAVNQRAGFNGVLFNGPAVAYIQTQFSFIQHQDLLNRNRDLQEMMARYIADVQRLQIEIISAQEQNRIILSGRDNEINVLNQVITQQQNASSSSGLNSLEIALLVGGGFLAGTLMTGIILYLFGHVQ